MHARAAVRVTGHVGELALCDAQSMSDKPRYRLRANSAALSRLQWWIVGIAILIAAFGVVLAITGRAAPGAMLMGLSGMMIAFTVISATRQGPTK
jgi:hypothetical protein